MIRGLAALFALFTVVVVGLTGALGWLVWEFRRPGPLAEPAVVEIQRGRGLQAIADRLQSAGVVVDANVFIWGTRFLGHHAGGLQAGEYRFPAHISAQGAMVMMRDGRALLHAVTVAEGLTSFEVIAHLQADDRLTGDVPPPPPEGSLLPETYHVIRGQSRAELIARMRNAATEAVTTLWPARAEGLPLAAPEQAVILASIVEKETAVPAERPMVARVLLNRLEQGMRLEVDPTVIYALTQGRGPLGRELTRRDLAIDSPFNTYRVAGLPPSPICNPGRAALEAVLHPAETDALYYVADGTGGHVFARTLEEHNRNAEAWRRLRDQGGGRPATPPSPPP